MSRPVLTLTFGTVLAFVATRAVADNGEVPPPPTPSAQSPPTAASKAPPPTAAVQAPAAAPQTFTISVVPQAPQQAPAPQTQTITLKVVADTTPAAPVPTVQAVAAAPAAVAGEVKHAGPFMKLVGAVGEKISKAGYDRILVPPQAAQAVVAPVQYTVQAAAPTVQAVAVQPVQAVTATPQASAVQAVVASPTKKCRLFGR